MLFDPPKELPTATLHVEPRTFTELVARGVALWFTERWSWLRPRAIPVLVAVVGLLGTIEAMNQLSTPPKITEQARVIDLNPHDFSRVRIVLQQ